jgi:hypothetical protein
MDLREKMEMECNATSTESMPSQTMLLSAHKASIRALGKLPQFDYMPYRAYNKPLRVIRQIYFRNVLFCTHALQSS